MLCCKAPGHRSLRPICLPKEMAAFCSSDFLFELGERGWRLLVGHCLAGRRVYGSACRKLWAKGGGRRGDPDRPAPLLLLTAAAAGQGRPGYPSPVRYCCLSSLYCQPEGGVGRRQGRAGGWERMPPRLPSPPLGLEAADCPAAPALLFLLWRGRGNGSTRCAGAIGGGGSGACRGVLRHQRSQCCIRHLDLEGKVKNRRSGAGRVASLWSPPLTSPSALSTACRMTSRC